MNTTTSGKGERAAALLLFSVSAVAILGVVIGVRRSPLDADAPQGVAPSLTASPAHATVEANGVGPAKTYTQMRISETGPTASWEPHWDQLTAEFDFRHCTTCHDPHTAKVQPSQLAKQASLAARAERRAFNGAPPVVPHAIELTNDAACFGCHSRGVQLGERIANPLSHEFLPNCLQCHAAPTPPPFAETVVAVANNFQGLAAPLGGARAYAGAPPVIPHSTWMREQCLSCHGGNNGWPGLEVSHRWRANCLQCHASTSPLDQVAPLPDAFAASTTEATR
ncbi:MAG: hypothetical protein KDA92_04490 [Planctomycetales bacterium]|nr:hypothetical protein [Planctomycetales bacterium]MCA9166429.1 hypothetical protein [Planctomycetales bacterium]